MKLSVAKIVRSTSADGVGLRNSLYVAGCDIQCKGCHNKDWWNINNGVLKDVEEVYEELCSDDCNISILGGEPLMQSNAVIELCRLIKSRTNKTIWLWSGHTFKYIQRHSPAILELIDVLVDGPYQEELHELDLDWRGSSNQRVIHLK